MDTPRPTRKTYRRPNLGLVDLANEFTKTAAEMELGWLALREHLHDAGWPTTTPAGDRKPSSARMTVRCGCGAPFVDLSEWQYHSTERGHTGWSKITPAEPPSIDYHDPTGELALSLDRWHRDLERLQDARHAIEGGLRALRSVTTRYRDGYHPATPLCSRNGCTEEVERRVSHNTAKVTYVGMEQIAGVWVAKVGVLPECSKHRTASRREAA